MKNLNDFKEPAQRLASIMMAVKDDPIAFVKYSEILAKAMFAVYADGYKEGGEDFRALLETVAAEKLNDDS